MTEEKEQMLRLIENEEIVGYEVKYYSDGESKVITQRSKSLTEWGDSYTIDDPGYEKDFVHDSFNLSFQIGDTRVFAGDKVILIISDIYGVDEYKGSIIHEEHTFKFIENGHEAYRAQPIHSFLNNDFKLEIKVTGNKYENSNEHLRRT